VRRLRLGAARSRLTPLMVQTQVPVPHVTLVVVRRHVGVDASPMIANPN